MKEVLIFAAGFVLGVSALWAYIVHDSYLKCVSCGYEPVDTYSADAECPQCEGWLRVCPGSSRWLKRTRRSGKQ